MKNTLKAENWEFPASHRKTVFPQDELWLKWRLSFSHLRTSELVGFFPDQGKAVHFHHRYWALWLFGHRMIWLLGLYFFLLGILPVFLYGNIYLFCFFIGSPDYLKKSNIFYSYKDRSRQTVSFHFLLPRRYMSIQFQNL